MITFQLRLITSPNQLPVPRVLQIYLQPTHRVRNRLLQHICKNCTMIWGSNWWANSNPYNIRNICQFQIKNPTNVRRLRNHLLAARWWCKVPRRPIFLMSVYTIHKRLNTYSLYRYMIQYTKSHAIYTRYILHLNVEEHIGPSRLYF